MIYPDLERELHEDRTAEIERKNRESSVARDLVARVVANHRTSDGRLTRAHLRRPATERPVAKLRPLNPKPRTGRPPTDPERKLHWGTAMLDYVRRDSDEQREAWEQNSGLLR